MTLGLSSRRTWNDSIGKAGEEELVDALMMAAGRGSRLGPLTDGHPKGLMDLGGISPIELQVDLLADRGIDRLIVVTGYGRDLVEQAVRTRAPSAMRVTFVWNPFWSVTNVLGSAWMASQELDGGFVYLHADTVFDPSILDDCLATSWSGALPIDLRPCEPEQMKATVEGDRVVLLSKELTPEVTAGEFIGIGVFQARAVAFLQAGMALELAAGGVGSYFEAAINRAVAGDDLDIEAIPTLGRSWTEIDFPEDLEVARRLLPSLLS